MVEGFSASDPYAIASTTTSDIGVVYAYVYLIVVRIDEAVGLSCGLVEVGDVAMGRI